MMLIAIENRALKSFVDRLQALKASYPLTVVTMAALDGSELFSLDVEIGEEQLASFAQDAKFGFGPDFKIERILKSFPTDYQTEHFVDVLSGENFEADLLKLRQQFSEANVSYRALEYSQQNRAEKVIRAYVSNQQEQQTLQSLVA